MTRRTRPQAERLEAIAFSIDRASGGINTTLLIVVLAAALSGAGVGYWLRGDLRAAAGGAGVTGFVAVVFVVAASWDLARCAITRQPEPTDDDDRFTQTGPRTLRRLPDGWTRAQYTEYMTAVLDDDDDTGFNQRDAAAFGHDRAKFNALVKWMADRGWYRYSNGVDNRNGGEFVAAPAIILTPPGDIDD